MKCLMRGVKIASIRVFPALFRLISQAAGRPESLDGYENFTMQSTMKATTMTAAMTSMVRRGTRASRRSVAG